MKKNIEILKGNQSSDKSEILLKLNEMEQTIDDKDYEIKGQVSDIGLFYVILKTGTNEKIMVPNNVFLQKGTKITVE